MGGGTFVADSGMISAVNSTQGFVETGEAVPYSVSLAAASTFKVNTGDAMISLIMKIWDSMEQSRKEAAVREAATVSTMQQISSTLVELKAENRDISSTLAELKAESQALRGEVDILKGNGASKLELQDGETNESWKEVVEKINSRMNDVFEQQRDELLQYREIYGKVSDAMRNAIEDCNAALDMQIEEADWGGNESIGLYSTRPETDARDWPSRTQVLDDKEQMKDRDLRRDDRSYRAPDQMSYSQPSSRQQEGFVGDSRMDNRPPPPIQKAASPWMPRRGKETEKGNVLRTVKGILNKLTPEKYDVLFEQLLQAGIDSAEILKVVVSLIFDKAVVEPTFCSMYSQLCVHLNQVLQEFPSPVEGEKITFRRILLNTCQEEFERADALRAEIRQMKFPDQEAEMSEERKVKYRTLGNIKFIGELFKQKMITETTVHECIQELLGPDPHAVPVEENVESLCQFFSTVGKQMEENLKSRPSLDNYFGRMKEFSSSSQLPSRLRFIVKDILDLRSNKWVPRREEVKAKTIHEIHVEAEQKLGLRPGSSFFWNGRAAASLIEEYFSIGDLKEATLCIQELKSPIYHAQIVQQAILMAFDKKDKQRDLVFKLLKHLRSNATISKKSLDSGLLKIARQLDELAMDAPNAPKQMGELVGNLISGGVMDFVVLRQIVEVIEDEDFQKKVVTCAVKTITTNGKGEELLNLNNPALSDCLNLTRRSGNSLAEFLQSLTI